ncbi:MAG: hypothetical protein HYU86_07725 [Chloroflexi bacterium]|nr:hypothetical protein [Chloroflexota bacterium]
MPISKAEFESEGDPVASVLDLLRTNSHLSFTAQELLIELASLGMNLNEEELREILNALERRGRVESRTVRGLVYYIYASKMGFRPYRE